MYSTLEGALNKGVGSPPPTLAVTGGLHFHIRNDFRNPWGEVYGITEVGVNIYSDLLFSTSVIITEVGKSAPHFRNHYGHHFRNHYGSAFMQVRGHKSTHFRNSVLVLRKCGSGLRRSLQVPARLTVVRLRSHPEILRGLLNGTDPVKAFSRCRYFGLECSGVGLQVVP